MNFGNLMDSAKNAATQLGGSNDAKPQNPSNPNPNPTDNQNSSAKQKWEDVGSSAKAAQERQARGEAMDYKELGSIGQKAAAAYNTEGGPKDAAGIGKMIGGGLFGGKKEGQQPQQQGGQQQQPQVEQQQQQQQQQ